MTLTTLKALFETGKYQEILDLLARKESQGEFNSLGVDEQISGLYYKCRSLEGLGQNKKALNIAIVARAKFISSNDPALPLALIVAQLYALYRLGQLNEALEVIDEGTALVDTLTTNERKSGAFWIATFENVKGNIYFDNIELDKALVHYQKSLTMFEVLNESRSITLTLDNIGNVYRIKGELDTALEYFQRSLALKEIVNNPLDLGVGLGNIGLIYRDKGELDNALKNFQQSLALYETINSPQRIAGVLEVIGLIYRSKGDFTSASTYLQRSLVLNESLGNDLATSEGLFFLTLLTLDQQDEAQAHKYLNKLKKLYSRTPNRWIYLASRIAEALILKQSKLLKNRIQAQNILEQLVNEELVFEIYALVMIHLCDLLIFEVKSFGNREVWEKVKTFVQELYVKAQEQQFLSLIVEVLILRAKFAAVEGDLQQTLDYFDQASLVATEKNLVLLINKVRMEREAFESELIKWQKLIESHPSLQERIKYVHIEKYITEVRDLIEKGKK
ncbi:MAG: tetratricopeptide repeat protein [Candidatus Hodarchaeota archaeon]